MALRGLPTVLKAFTCFDLIWFSCNDWREIRASNCRSGGIVRFAIRFGKAAAAPENQQFPMRSGPLRATRTSLADVLRSVLPKRVARRRTSVQSGATSDEYSPQSENTATAEKTKVFSAVAVISTERGGFSERSIEYPLNVANDLDYVGFSPLVKSFASELMQVSSMVGATKPPQIFKTPTA